MKRILSLLLVIGVLYSFQSDAQEENKGADEGYIFTVTKSLAATPVKNQYKSSTCWSFSTLSFLESELLRMGKGEYDLSEMFIIHHAYDKKAEKYVRLHGSLEFGGGGAFHDVIEMIRKYGIEPEVAYNGKVIEEENHVHNEMDGVLQAYVNAVIENPNKKLTPVWHQGFEGILNAYLGTIPETYEYRGNKFTPKTFAESLGLSLDDYIELSSYTHHPFYEEFMLEVPDNWMGGSVYNIPINELIEVIDYSIEKGYTVAWGADISERGFSWKNGVAIVPDYNNEDLTGTEREKWEKLTEKEKQDALYKFDKPGKEKAITQEMRQVAFDNYSLTDDHGMHITGTAKDQNGNDYYLVKNSWGTEGKYNGYFYASKAFVMMNTMDIMVHKDAIPQEIMKKLGL